MTDCCPNERMNLNFDNKSYGSTDSKEMGSPRNNFGFLGHQAYLICCEG